MRLAVCLSTHSIGLQSSVFCNRLRYRGRHHADISVRRNGDRPGQPKTSGPNIVTELKSHIFALLRPRDIERAPVIASKMCRFQASRLDDRAFVVGVPFHISFNEFG